MSPLDGRWALIFSTQKAPPATASRQGNMIQPLIDTTYAAFFKVAPALAGAQQDGPAGPSNEQLLSLAEGVAENRVRISLPSWLPNEDGRRYLEICVDGLARPCDEPDLLAVEFTKCSFRIASSSSRNGDGSGALSLPLPRPVGTLRTTHCDEDLRVSRGSRGGIFVLKRLRDST